MENSARGTEKSHKSNLVAAVARAASQQRQASLKWLFLKDAGMQILALCSANCLK